MFVACAMCPLDHQTYPTSVRVFDTRTVIFASAALATVNEQERWVTADGRQCHQVE